MHFSLSCSTISLDHVCEHQCVFYVCGHELTDVCVIFGGRRGWDPFIACYSRESFISRAEPLLPCLNVEFQWNVHADTHTHTQTHSHRLDDPSNDGMLRINFVWEVELKEFSFAFALFCFHFCAFIISSLWAPPPLSPISRKFIAQWQYR